MWASGSTNVRMGEAYPFGAQKATQRSPIVCPVLNGGRKSFRFGWGQFVQRMNQLNWNQLEPNGRIERCAVVDRLTSLPRSQMISTQRG